MGTACDDFEWPASAQIQREKPASSPWKNGASSKKKLRSRTYWSILGFPNGVLDGLVDFVHVNAALAEIRNLMHFQFRNIVHG